VNVSTQLDSFTDPVRVVFFDYDKTLIVGSSGDTLLAICDPNCVSYTPAVACTCNQTTTAFGDFLVANLASRVLGDSDILFNGVDRRDRLAQTFALILTHGVEIKILSTSWYDLSAGAWQYAIHKMLDVANLSSYIPLKNILTLADPGDGIAADKGTVMQTYLATRGWGPHNGLFCDDSPSNIKSANGKIDWMQIFPRTGMAQNQLVWVEDRAKQTFGKVCACPHGTPTVKDSGSDATLCQTDNTQDCSACAVGYRLSSPARLGWQSCVAVPCAVLTPSFGTPGTCTPKRVTGATCSITCLKGYTLQGGATQLCVGAASGPSQFQNTQSCLRSSSVGKG